jgi:CubicO group peptidase (beta-lactamase class C family)
MVERVTKQTLNDYMREHIWEPLGMKSTTFRLRERPDISERRADISKRAEDGTLIPMIERVVGNDTPDDRGGGGLHSSTGDYVKLLIALLKNDGTLMKPETVDALLFEPCLSSAAREALQANRTAGHKKDQEDPMLMNGMEVAGRVDYAPAGLVELDSKPGGRSENSVGWGGYPNLTWVMDRKSGIIFFSGTQIIPPGDRIKKKAFAMFETAIYSGELGPLTS